MPDTKEITRVGHLLTAISREKNWTDRLGLHVVFLCWNDAVGGDVARRAQPQVIRGTVLWVNVTDSVWMQQLHLEKATLLDRLNRRICGAKKLTDIRFRLAGSRERTVDGGPLPTPRPPKRPPDPQKAREFEELLESLGDEEAKEVLRRFWRKFHES